MSTKAITARPKIKMAYILAVAKRDSKLRSTTNIMQSDDLTTAPQNLPLSNHDTSRHLLPSDSLAPLVQLTTQKLNMQV
jgi:hypothetical protein